MACDACKRRKVKCNGIEGCNQCTHLNLKCHFSAPTRSSRSRKSIARGHVIESCKDGSVNQKSTSSCLAALIPSGLPRDPAAEKPGSFSASFFGSLVEDYSSFVLPVLPIISGDEFRSAISEMETNQASSALVHGLGAITMNTTAIGHDEVKTSSELCKALYVKALELRGPLLPDHQVTVRSIMIPLVVATCLFANHCNIDMAFYYLREAITGIQILRMNEPISMTLPTPGKMAQQERLYWLLFVHERYNSLSFHQPATLSALPALPQPDPAIPVGVMDGFHHIISLFKTIDREFIENWLNKPSPAMNSAWIEQKQSELGDNVATWENEIKVLTTRQQIDLIVTRHWLRTLVWQMALSRFLLLSDDPAGRDCMEMIFPARISRRLRLVLANMPRQMVEIHGTGILQKIFDITSTLADILEHVLVPQRDDQAAANHLDDFVFLYEFLLSMSKFYHVEKAFLESKFESTRRLFPSLTIISDQLHARGVFHGNELEFRTSSQDIAAMEEG
jgi:hypothetical protein